MITIKQAFEIRDKMKVHKKIDYPLVSVVAEIILGTYDQYKGEGQTVANEDYDFLKKEREEWVKDKTNRVQNKKWRKNMCS